MGYQPYAETVLLAFSCYLISLSISHFLGWLFTYLFWPFLAIRFSIEELFIVSFLGPSLRPLYRASHSPYPNPAPFLRLPGLVCKHVSPAHLASRRPRFQVRQPPPQVQKEATRKFSPKFPPSQITSRRLVRIAASCWRCSPVRRPSLSLSFSFSSPFIFGRDLFRL